MGRTVDVLAGICPVGPGDLWAVRALPSALTLRPTALPLTHYPGHTGFLLFLKHTKPSPASGPFHSPWDTFPHIPEDSHHIPIFAQLAFFQRSLPYDPIKILFTSLHPNHPICLPGFKA